MADKRRPSGAGGGTEKASKNVIENVKAIAHTASSVVQNRLLAGASKPPSPTKTKEREAAGYYANKAAFRPSSRSGESPASPGAARKPRWSKGGTTMAADVQKATNATARIATKYDGTVQAEKDKILTEYIRMNFMTLRFSNYEFEAAYRDHHITKYCHRMRTAFVAIVLMAAVLIVRSATARGSAHELLRVGLGLKIGAISVCALGWWRTTDLMRNHALNTFATALIMVLIPSW